MSLDCSGDPNSKFKLILWKHHGGGNQRWKFVPDGQGNYSIVCVGNSGTVEIPDFSNGAQGTQLHVSQPNGTMNEKWRIQSVGGSYSILSAQNNLSFNVLGGNCFEGDKVGIWPFAGIKNDTWTITPC